MFKPEDSSRILELANRYAAFDGETSEADLFITNYFPQGFWVAEVQNEVIGFAYGYFNEFPEDILQRWGASKVGYVASVAVDAKYRRQGIGEVLVRRVLKEFAEAGVDLVLVDCPSESVGGREMFEKLGFGIRSVSLRLRLNQKSKKPSHQVAS